MVDAFKKSDGGAKEWSDLTDTDKGLIISQVTRAHYADYIATPGVWGTAVEVGMAAALLDAVIEVYDAKPGKSIVANAWNPLSDLKLNHGTTAAASAPNPGTAAGGTAPGGAGPVSSTSTGLPSPTEMATAASGPTAVPTAAVDPQDATLSWAVGGYAHVHVPLPPAPTSPALTTSPALATSPATSPPSSDPITLRIYYTGAHYMSLFKCAEKLDQQAESQCRPGRPGGVVPTVVP